MRNILNNIFLFLRSILDDIKVRIEEFHEQNQSIFDLFSLSQLQKWSQSQREQ